MLRALGTAARRSAPAAVYAPRACAFRTTAAVWTSPENYPVRLPRVSAHSQFEHIWGFDIRGLSWCIQTGPLKYVPQEMIDEVPPIVVNADHVLCAGGAALCQPCLLGCLHLLHP